MLVQCRVLEIGFSVYSAILVPAMHGYLGKSWMI